MMSLFNSAFENFKEKFRKMEKLPRKCVNLQGAITYVCVCVYSRLNKHNIAKFNVVHLILLTQKLMTLTGAAIKFNWRKIAQMRPSWQCVAKGNAQPARRIKLNE